MIDDVISCILIQILSFYLDFYQAELQCHMVQMLFRIVPRYFADNIMRRYRSSERIPCIDNNVRRVVARAHQSISHIFRRLIVLPHRRSSQMKQWCGLWRWLFCDPISKNNILSRLHKVYVVGYIVAHHFSGVFNW